VIVEVNNGGELVTQVLKGARIKLPIKPVHASRGKLTRAEPIVAAYERGEVHHAGLFASLEDECCTWVPGVGTSPDRVDALVWALTELLLNGGSPLAAPRVLNLSPSRWAPVRQRAGGGAW
jgi:phage terminase large subunit-like protein